MKALSVTQPWASIICTGIKDVENRPYQSVIIPGRILIHATAAKVPGNWEMQPSEYVSHAKNGRLMGQFPEYKDMPNGAIIGYADCYKIVKNSDSMWAQPGFFHWCLRDARLFDKPIYGIKGARGHMFDVPEIDENNLPPSHEWVCRFPDIQGDTIILPVSDAVMADIEAGVDHIAYDLTDIIEELFFNPESGEPIEYHTIQFVGKDKTIMKQFDGVESGPYEFGGKTYEVPEYQGEGILWSYCAVFFK